MSRTISNTPRVIVAAVMIAVGILAAAAGLTVGLGDDGDLASLSAGAGQPAAKTFTLRGTLEVNCGGSCLGYRDIGDGGQVEIINDRHEVLAVTALRKITSDAGYTAGQSYEFVVANVPRGEKLYGVQIGNQNRGVIWKSEQEAASIGFRLTLG